MESCGAPTRTSVNDWWVFVVKSVALRAEKLCFYGRGGKKLHNFNEKAILVKMEIEVNEVFGHRKPLKGYGAITRRFLRDWCLCKVVTR